MAYDYAMQRPKLFTEAGVKILLQMHANADRGIEAAGSVRMDKLILGISGDTWDMLACADYLVEIGHLQEVTQRGVAGQHRVFVRRAAS